MTENIGKRQRTRTAIMHAAKGLFEEKGIKNVTFNEIANRVGMCRTTIFNHFSTINDLMLALTEQEVDDLITYSEASPLKGNALVTAMFHKLIEDSCNYPALSTRLINNSIIDQGADGPIKRIEAVVSDNLEGRYTKKARENKVVTLTGIYYGIINHYFINGKDFDAKEMKRLFNTLTKDLF